MTASFGGSRPATSAMPRRPRATRRWPSSAGPRSNASLTCDRRVGETAREMPCGASAHVRPRAPRSVDISTGPPRFSRRRRYIRYRASRRCDRGRSPARGAAQWFAMTNNGDEDLAAALKNARVVLAARQRIEEELRSAKAELEEQHRDLELLNRTAALLGANLDLESVVQAVTDAGTQLTGAEFGAFFYTVKDPGGGV